MRTRLILIAAMWAALLGPAVGNALGQAPAEPGRQFSLVGVVMLESGSNLAWIQEPTLTKDKVVTVRLGDSLGPYRVTKILSHQVELTGPGGTVVIPLAGAPGGVAVASVAGTAKPPAVETPSRPVAALPPVPAPNAVIPIGDPRGHFPASRFLLGAGATISGPASEGPSVQAAEAQTTQPGVTSTQTAAAPAAAQAPGAPQPNVMLPRGDPRRGFPASKFLIGAR